MISSSRKLIPPRWRAITNKQTKEVSIEKWERKAEALIRERKPNKNSLFELKKGWTPPFPTPILLKR
jgi:hypothetical protein